MSIETIPTSTSTLDDVAGLLSCCAAEDSANSVRDLIQAAGATLISSRHHWLRFDGTWHGRKEFRDALTAAEARPYETWTEADAELVLGLAVLRRAGIGLEQLAGELSLRSVRAVLAQRLDGYLLAIGQPRTLDHLSLLELADRTRKVREYVERDYFRYSVIDGAKWHRTEGLLARAQVSWTELPGRVVEGLTAIAPGLPDTRVAARWLPAATRQCLTARGQSKDLVDALMRCAVRDRALAVDHVTVTCVRGVLLDRPGELDASDQFFTHTVLDDGLALAGFAEQLGHESEQRLRATLRARMIKLKRKAVVNYFGDGCLRGEWVEKAADNMIFFNEDTHYRGHQTVGCSTGGRSAFEVSYRRDRAEHTLPPMMGDFRVVRLSHDPERRFAVDNLRHVIRYAQWVRLVVQETFRAGGVLELLPSETARGAVCPR
ncbi:hypothetical protein [Nocardia brasiliensis]|uniref:hypothetical protein n=1 Tax=Nocardia brasiliensis TaxID=37326 RepID=UPI0004A77B78|nr:hypothetical protein [Nocardia brasiliensis]